MMFTDNILNISGSLDWAMYVAHSIDSRKLTVDQVVIQRAIDACRSQ